MAIQKVPGNMIQLDSQANSDIMNFNGTDWVRLEKGVADEILTVNEAADAPEWGEPACTFQGTERGYVCGGYLGPPSIYGRQIQRFSLTSDGDSTDIADMISNRRGQGGHSSSTHGYITGGGLDVPSSFVNSIERFPFASDADSIDWADLTATKRNVCSVSSSNSHRITLGGNDDTGTTDVIDKFPFASQTNATDWADATVAKTGGAGCSSITHGYSLGGTEQPGSAIVYVIERFPFASQPNSVDVADITLARGGAAGVSSCEDAYAVGGVTVGNNPANGAPLWDRTTIDKHSFASGGNSTDHGDLPVEEGAGAHSQGGVSGTTHGYSVGGIYSYNNQNHQKTREQIEKFA